MTKVNCSDWHCQFNKNSYCSLDEIQLGRSMLNSVANVFSTDDLFRCLSKVPITEKPAEPKLEILDKVLDPVWEYLNLTKEQFERQCVRGNCVKCGSTAKYKNGCLCPNHTRGYHKWRNTRERKRIERVKEAKGIQ